MFSPVGWLDKLSALSNSLWDKLNIDILWEWLPSDISVWIGTFIGIMFLVALKRVLIS